MALLENVTLKVHLVSSGFIKVILNCCVFASMETTNLIRVYHLVVPFTPNYRDIRHFIE